MTSNGGGDKGLQQVNHHHVKEDNGIVGVGWGLNRDGELRVNKSDDDVKDRGGEAVQGEFVVHAPQLQPQGMLVQWEKFLHVRSIKVMLVENDDSTRHIVTALLRNCNYEVIEAANGLQAWKFLEDLTNHIDIVLTEVAMPVVSGVGLLCKIMSHNTRKSIPVIMMSSHDSMGLVFKCLTKGAVDFLVKPIRKNELKNLWQHVWRRCQSSSGSGSGSFTETQKSVKSRSSLRSDNNSGSNDGEDSSSNGLSTGDGSDHGSGAQSSWTKQAVDVDSSQADSQLGQKAECPDSTCGQVIRSNAESPGTRDAHGQQECNTVAKGKGLVIGKSRNYEMLDESQNTLQEVDPALNSKRKDKGRENRSSGCSSHKHTAAGHNTADSERDVGEFEEPGNVEIKNSVTDDSNEGAVGEHSLKRFREVKDRDKTVQYDHIILRHSELSAFSRYNTGVHAFKAPNRISRSSSQVDDRLEITKKESTVDGLSCYDGYFATPSSEGNMGSTTDKLWTNPIVQNYNGLHPSSAFRPIKTDIRPTSQQVLPGKVDDMTLTSVLDPLSDPHNELPIQHIHHHHHVHHYHDMEGGQQLLSSPDDLSLNKLAADASHCGSSNVLGGVCGPVECNPGDSNLNRSVSGSKHGSNGPNGSSTVINAGGGINVESIVGVAQKTGNADESGSGSRNGINQSKSAQREAALTRFRQKRKERYFQKKVRYQNRKRLAEQRPRIRGQFIKQTDNDNSSSDPDS